MFTLKSDDNPDIALQSPKDEGGLFYLKIPSCPSDLTRITLIVNQDQPFVD
jgi:hypothetical protein